ncbi:MAG TPA: HAMP domain-containing sensor histidine kinase [Gemmatimonadaceae bacterium]|nr:HAMP domain-containing sensor histidine kinase [Gemmatimonadaceae bacterium]
MKRPSFRTRLILILILFAVIPASVLMLGGGVLASRALPLVSGSGAWERVARSGARAIDAMRAAELTPAQRAALAQHEQELNASLEQARRFRYLSERAPYVVAILALLGSGLLALVASRVAAHLSRQLSRPLTELVGWTELIARGRPLPEHSPKKRGAPEFEVLRRRMRRMASELETARERELEAERLEAFRETARRVAHELKNPLTPIRFAVERLRREAPPPLGEVVEVLATESRRLEEMARSFSQFGRLPEGPVSEVDLGELARYTARATVPEGVPLEVEVEPGLPMVRGHHDALARALSNVLINAVEACRDGGGVEVRVARASRRGEEAVELRVRDGGGGIPPQQLAQIWEPYATFKPGGTGLGLAIARQTVQAHRGLVEARSDVGRGTEIRFILPVNGTPAHD